MSGGHWNYKDESLKNEIFDYSEKPTNQFEDIEISQLVWDIFELMHEYDWYVSGDTGKEDYDKVKKEFKARWLARGSATREIRLEAIIDARLSEIRDELKDML